MEKQNEEPEYAEDYIRLCLGRHVNGYPSEKTGNSELFDPAELSAAERRIFDEITGISYILNRTKDKNVFTINGWGIERRYLPNSRNPGKRRKHAFFHSICGCHPVDLLMPAFKQLSRKGEIFGVFTNLGSGGCGSSMLRYAIERYGKYTDGDRKDLFGDFVMLSIDDKVDVLTTAILGDNHNLRKKSQFHIIPSMDDKPTIDFLMGRLSKEDYYNLSHRVYK